MVSASMGIYVFNTKALLEELIADAEDPDSIPRFRQRHSAQMYRTPPCGGLGLQRH